MDAQARAGIDLQGNVLRYAEVEQYGDHCRLLRLGSCDFDFDVAGEVLYARESPHLDTVTEALNDVFAGSVAQHFNIALHPPSGYSFFTALPADLSASERENRIAQEVALLTATPSVPTLRFAAENVTEETLDDGQAISRIHVLALQDTVHNRLEQIFQALPYPNRRLKLSMQAAAAVVGRLTTRRRDIRPRNDRSAYSLALGWYQSHVEYTLCRHGRWYFSHFANVQSTADGAYFAVTLLKRLGLAAPDVREVFVYGNNLSHADFSILQAIFEIESELLNPIVAIDLDPGSLSASFEAEAYVPCIGAAL